MNWFYEVELGLKPTSFKHSTRPPISVQFTIRILGRMRLTATYTINRLRLCYATTVSPKQKFDPCARKCIFIGYPHSKKTYILFDIDANTFFTSRYVIFHESVFPFCQQSQTQSSPPSQGIFPIIDIDLPTPVQHSLDQPSSLTHHNTPEPPPNQPSSSTRHNTPEPPSNQPSSPTHHNTPEPPVDQPSSPCQEV